MDDEFLKRLVETFRVEAEEHLDALSSGLLDLERAESQHEKDIILETVYREAHSLKGGARAVNMKAIETVCQAVEGVLSELRRENIAVSTDLFDTLHRTLDSVNRMVSTSERVEISGLVEDLKRLKAGEAKPQTHDSPKSEESAQPPPAETAASEAPPTQDPEETPGSEVTIAPGAMERSANVQPPPQEDAIAVDTQGPHERKIRTDTVRVGIDKLAPLLVQTEEMLAVKLTSSERATDLWGIATSMAAWKERWSKLQSSGSHGKQGGRIDKRYGAKEKTGEEIEELKSFLEWNKGYIDSLEERIRSLAKEAENDSRHFSGMVEDLLDGMKQVLMLPVSTVLELFPKLVRDLARELGKEADLVIQGGDLEIDRRILEEMKDPLIHIFRNCLDHGIETPEERVSKGKPPRGRMTLSVSKVGTNHAEIVVSDDGVGIDVDSIKSAAVRRGATTDAMGEALEENDAVSLIFRSGVSTCPIVTDISGHGIGLAIVRDKVEKVGGRISVETSLGQGTLFRLVLPVTLATFRGILIQAADRLFVLPTASVERVFRVKTDALGTVENREIIEFGGQAVSYVRLSEVLELPSNNQNKPHSEWLQVLVVRTGETRIAFGVDRILKEQEVLVKGLGKQLIRVRNIAGSTVLGSGKLVPILNVSDLVKSAVNWANSGARSLGPVETIEQVIKSVLVVEDSITSRMLLKNILETSGYQVQTAVDGADGWDTLQSNSFDLVVSDVEMPRLTGYELTERIRANAEFANLPVVLVTSRGSREDQERGIDAGANAYIVKSSFDQSNLLEVVGRLI